MFNLTAPRAPSDSSNPVSYVDTSYDALKYNVPATQQLLQAAQQGQPVGLAGIGAMAAQKFQQNAQTAQQQQNAMQQAPSPTVLDQIVNSGIMSQLQPSIQMAQAPSTPMEPQQMAIGGMVALNDGGFVDYSYDNGAGYAGGGELRGFATGTSELLRAMNIPDSAGYYELGESLTDADNKMLQELMQEDEQRYRDRMLRKQLAGEQIPESTLQRRGGMYQPELPETPEPRTPYKDIYGGEPAKAETYGSRPSYSEKYGAGPSQAPEYSPRQPSAPAPTPAAKPSMIEGMSQAAHAPTDPMAEAMAKSGKAPFKAPLTTKGRIANMGKGLRALGRVAGPLGWASEVYGMYDVLSDPNFQEQYKQDWKENMPEFLGGEKRKPVNEPETPLAHQDKVTVKAEPSDEAKNTDKGSEYKSPVEIHSEQDAQPRREAGIKGAQLASASTTSIPGLEPIPAEVARADTMRQIREDMQNTGMPAPTTTSTPAIERGVNALPTDWDNAPSTDDYQDQLEMLQRIYQGDRTGKLSPEIASRMAAMEDQATRDKWLGALTGFGAGMFGADTPYMSQAIASGALMGLSNYQRGAQNEEQTALRRLQAEAAAEKEPEEARQKAINTYMQAQLASGKSAADLRKEILKQQSLQARDVYKAGAAKERAQIIAQAQAAGLTLQQAVNASHDAAILGDKRVSEFVGTLTPAQEQAIRDKAAQDIITGAAQMMRGSGAISSGMSSGTGLGGRSIIMQPTGQLINR